mmetsp:Transcript_433/g.1639  ORF Transcript_433/g.1639 Transcript_433/m.1639 type:complete len:180 (-) Transcript_433:317-856(-)
MSVLNRDRAPHADVIAGTTVASGEPAGAAEDVVFLQAKLSVLEGGNAADFKLNDLNVELAKCGLPLLSAPPTDGEAAGEAAGGAPSVASDEAAPFSAALRQELLSGGGKDPLFVALLVNRAATPEVLQAARENTGVLVATVEAEHKAGEASRYVVGGPEREDAREAFYPLFVPVLRDGA